MRLQRGGKPLAGIESRWFERHRFLYYVDKFLSKGESRVIALLLVKPLFSDVNLGSWGPRRALYPEFAGSWLLLTENNVPVKVAHRGVGSLPLTPTGIIPTLPSRLRSRLISCRRSLFPFSPRMSTCPHCSAPSFLECGQTSKEDEGVRHSRKSINVELYLRPVFQKAAVVEKFYPFAFIKDHPVLTCAGKTHLYPSSVTQVRPIFALPFDSIIL